VEKDNSPLNDRAIEHPGNSFGSLDPQLERPAAYRSRVRHPEIWISMRSAYRMKRRRGRSKDQGFILDAPAVEADGPGHDRSIAFTLCTMTYLTRANLTSHRSFSIWPDSDFAEATFGRSCAATQ
jgi:hypothetical protein